MKATGIYNDLGRPYDFGPEVLKIEAQFEEHPCTLKVTIEFSNSNTDFKAVVQFKDVEGIKVLDEGDLLNFWQGDDLPKDWMWKVSSEGWFDEERQNDGFTMLSTRFEELTEYLIVGEGKCVCVICDGNERPTVTLLD